jgi:hypothetical protein
MRSVIINFLDGYWKIGLMQDMVVMHRVDTSNYHNIGSIVSNWIINNTVDTL